MSLNLVTGATGLLGAHTCLRLLEKGIKVLALFRNEAGKEFTRKIFSFYGKEMRFKELEWRQADLLDTEQLFTAFDAVNTVYHCAALVSFRTGEEKNLIFVNKEGTANVVNLCLERKVEKLCYVSSVAALGRGLEKPTDETFVFDFSSEKTAYGRSKFEGEMEVWRGIEEGLNAVIVNPSIILGPGNWSNGSPQLFKKAYEGMLFSSPGSTGFVDVRDVVEIMIQLTESNTSAERFLVNGFHLSYTDFFQMVCKALGSRPPSIIAPRIAGELMWRWESLLWKLSGRTPLLTRETVNTAFKNQVYDNKKILHLLDYKFIPSQESITFIAQKFLEDNPQ
jgi:dihydroflavonol-4-reductase